MILFHGSNVEVKNPKIIISNRTLDFGAGFYTTSSEEQTVLLLLKPQKLTGQYAFLTWNGLSVLEYREVKYYE